MDLNFQKLMGEFICAYAEKKLGGWCFLLRHLIGNRVNSSIISFTACKNYGIQSLIQGLPVIVVTRCTDSSSLHFVAEWSTSTSQGPNSFS
jgi:hypothetical protein